MDKWLVDAPSPIGNVPADYFSVLVKNEEET